MSEYIKHFSAIGLTGPRQSGKSTLLLHQLKDYQYVTFDDFRTVALYHDDPNKFMRIYANKIIFDEVQKVPEIFNDIKIAIDADRQTPGKFILTGSSQFSLIKSITESLAGRIGSLSLLPYQYSEMPDKLRYQSIYQGAYPEMVNKQYEFSADWYSSYLDTYIAKDVNDLANIGDKRDFRRLISMLAANTSQILNMSTYAKDLGVDVKTIKRWISVLEASYIIFLLPPYYQNFGKRIVKSPKLYFYDTGLVSYLTGIQNENSFEQGPMLGSIFENYIISDILKRELHNKSHAELFYFRSSNGEEIDLIIDRKQTRELIEIKAGETFTPRMSKEIEKLKDQNDVGYLLYRGKSMEYLPDIHIMNYQNYLGPNIPQ
ncbi:MAG TPA: ATP-binding protein [Gammaproteobacteria bacterium]|nr:ATP-binding protein [Gammaproteobacteria bacterium]